MTLGNLLGSLKSRIWLRQGKKHHSSPSLLSSSSKGHEWLAIFLLHVVHCRPRGIDCGRNGAEGRPHAQRHGELQPCHERPPMLPISMGAPRVCDARHAPTLCSRGYTKRVAVRNGQRAIRSRPNTCVGRSAYCFWGSPAGRLDTQICIGSYSLSLCQSFCPSHRRATTVG